MADIGVLVGYGQDYNHQGKVSNSQDKIYEAIIKSGHKAYKIDEQWPRDFFFHFNNKYVERGEEGVGGDVFGEGGNLRRGKDFLIVSDTAFLFNQIKDNVDISNYFLAEQEVLKQAEEKYQTKIHLGPTGTQFKKEGIDCSNMGHGHIDMFSLVLPKSRILLYDTHFGKGANQSKKYNEIAEKENLKFIEFDGSKDGVWYPLNAAVIYDGNKEEILIDSKAKSLASKLDELGTKFIPVDMPQINNPAGKINCQTNTFYLNDLKKVKNFFK